MNDYLEQRQNKTHQAYSRIVIVDKNVASFSQLDEVDSIISQGGKLALFKYIEKNNDRSLYVTEEQLFLCGRLFEIFVGIINSIHLANYIKRCPDSYILYIMADMEKQPDIRKSLDDAYLYLLCRDEEFNNQFNDDNFVIMLRDNRHVDYSMDCVKIYENGRTVISYDTGFSVGRKEFELEKNLSEKLNKLAKIEVYKRKESSDWFIDDRMFLKEFIFVFGTKWQGIECERASKYKEYFLKKAPFKIIDIIMNWEPVEELFIKKCYKNFVRKD